jgi:Lectin C-type domain
MARRLRFALLAAAAAAASAAAAQPAALGGVVGAAEAAVREVALAMERALGPGAWCDAGKECGKACAPHACADRGTAGEALTCVDVGGRQLDKDVCGAGTKGNLVSEGRAFFRTPRGEARAGAGGAVKVGDPVVRRDVCAMKGVADPLRTAHEKNNLTFWLYGGTTNGVFEIFPGVLQRRQGHGFDSCADVPESYDPRARPWYVAASSGPKDVVFLFDKKLAAEDTLLRRALGETVGTLDARDHFAVVAFDDKGADVLGGNKALVAATSTARADLKAAISEVSSGLGMPNVTLALGKAFDLLQAAGADGGAATSGCSRLIVLLSNTDDACFAKCTGTTKATARCRCVQEARDYVATRQAALGDRTATLVAFTEGEGRGANRLARTLACDRLSAGIWKGVTDKDTASSAMKSYSQITAVRLYDDKPKVFASELYKDFSGLGEVFTLAVPVYDKDTVVRRLVGVAGADVTLGEVEAKFGDSAREQITALSLASRDCAQQRTLGSCDLQALRSQTQSECADILPAGTCYQFGEAVYVKGSNASTWDEASAKCEALGAGARLAKVNTAKVNEFLAGIFDADGAWIGLRSDKGKDWVWADGAALANGEEQWAGFDGKAEAAQVQKDMNGAACAAADRRGSARNWDVLSCSAARTYVCETTTGSAAAKAACGGAVFDGQSSTNGHKPVNEAGCPPAVRVPCSAEQDKQVDGAELFCKDSGDNRSNKGRMCCSGAGGSKWLKFGGAGVACLAFIALVIIVVACIHRRSSKSAASGPQPVGPTLREEPVPGREADYSDGADSDTPYEQVPRRANGHSIDLL